MKKKHVTKLICLISKKISLVLFIVMVHTSLKGQDRFEFGLNVNSGLYFSEEKVLGSNIDNGIQFGIGGQFNYLIANKTKLGLGLNYNYIHTFENYYYSWEPITPTLNAFDVPFTIQQFIYKNCFVAAGAGLLWHTDTSNGKDGLLWRWNVGAGYRFNKLVFSLNYTQNIKNHTLSIDSNQSDYPNFSDYKRKILSLKFEYSLWKF
jgi:hypothetical protein